MLTLGDLSVLKFVCMYCRLNNCFVHPEVLSHGIGPRQQKTFDISN